MTEALYTFQPDLSDSYSTLITGLVIGLGGLAGALYLLKVPGSRENRTFRQLGAMLLFFGFLIGAGMSLFSWWTTRKLSPVVLYPDAIETPFGRAEFDQIENAYIKEELQKSFIKPSIPTGSYKVLIIEEIGGKAHALSEENYDLPEIMAKLKEAVETRRGGDLERG